MKNRAIEHKDDWETLLYFYNELDKEFNFDFDPCPFQTNLEELNGLEVDWGERSYINPPYSQKLKEAFILKAIEESKKGKLCVMLIPTSTSTKIFHEQILPNKKEIRFIRGRIPFIGINNKGEFVNYHLESKSGIKKDPQEIAQSVKNNGQHDSMIVIFDGR